MAKQAKNLLNLDDLKELNYAVFTTFDITGPKYFKLVDAIRGAVNIAARYHPHEGIDLTKSVFLQKKSEGPKKLRKRSSKKSCNSTSSEWSSTVKTGGCATARTSARPRS